MTPRERVMTTFEHREPDRVPMWCGASPEFWAKAKSKLSIDDDEALRVRFHDDFRRVCHKEIGPQIPYKHPDTTYRTIFGIERHGLGYGQPFDHPLAGAGIPQIHDYPWPDPAQIDVSHIRAEADGWKGRYAVLGGSWTPYFHDAIDLLGMENMMFLMHDAPPVLDAVLEHLVDYYFEVSRQIFEAAADALDIFFIGNDFGSQTGPLVGEKQFRRFFLPHLKRLVDLGHDHKLKVMRHCGGGFGPLIPSMIEIGLDAVHAVQPSCRTMDLRRLKADFGAQMVFNGAIDSHHVLIAGTADLVRQRTREVLDIMMPGGGFIAGASHGYILEETPVENVVAMFDTVEEYGRYTQQ